MSSQAEQIREHITKHNSITAMEALNLYGCMRLAARIKDLRREGFSVVTAIIENNGKRYARYVQG